jgi:tetratricopeptide (TPR) repeat protein
MTKHLVTLALAALAAGCATHTAPTAGGLRYPAFIEPVIPQTLAAPADVVLRQQHGWASLQVGDLRGARSDFSDALKRAPDFYPAETGLGYVALASQQFTQAAARFDAAIARNGSYLPALLGRVDAALGAHDEAAAIAALERVVALDPSREDAKSRLEVLRVRAVQRQMSLGDRARAAGRLDEARAAFAGALLMSPSSAVILRELALVEVAAGALDDALAHARAAVALDATDAESYARLAEVLAAGGRQADAANAMDRAVVLDPRPDWRARADAWRAAGNAAALPAEYRAIPTARTVTRAAAAAFVGMRLKDLLDRGPRRAAVVVTDVGGHWAASWILAVTRAGVMDVLPNHTFQPGATMTRIELARLVSQLLTLVGPGRAQEAAGWRAARPAFTDLPANHLSYAAAAAAVAAGAMSAAGGSFAPTRPATGPELVEAVTRIAQLAGH